MRQKMKHIIFSLSIIVTILLIMGKANVTKTNDLNEDTPTMHTEAHIGTPTQSSIVTPFPTQVPTNEPTNANTSTPTCEPTIIPTSTPKATITVVIQPTITPTPTSTYTPTGKVLRTGVVYKGVMTAFSDTKGQQGDILKSGDCAVGRRNYLTSESTRSHTIDSGIPIYKYSYIPYGSILKLTLYNNNGSVKRTMIVEVKDDCLKRNEEKINEIAYYNKEKHPEIDWDNIDLWVDLWVPIEEKDITSIRQIGIEILKFGEWNKDDLSY